MNILLAIYCLIWCLKANDVSCLLEISIFSQYPWFALTPSKIQINDFFDKIFTKCKQPDFERFLKVSGRYTVKTRKEEHKKLRTNRLFYKNLQPLDKNQCQAVVG